MKKIIVIAIAAAVTTFFLIYIALDIKLAMLGSSTFSGDIGPAFLPLGHVETSHSGFTVENKIGSVVLPLLVGAVAGFAQFLKQSRKTTA